MPRFEVTLGETQFTSGHCHKCAHMELTFGVDAATKAKAVEQIREELCGTEHTVELSDGTTAVLLITHDASLLGTRSVKVFEEY